jgi:hypothetical protein
MLRCGIAASPGCWLGVLVRRCQCWRFVTRARARVCVCLHVPVCPYVLLCTHKLPHMAERVVVTRDERQMQQPVLAGCVTTV